MKAKTFSTMGAMHPVLFFAGVYIVALFFSIFICSSLFYSCNASSADFATEKKATPNEKLPPAANAALAVQE
jgi:hypothetical protein